MQSRMTNVTTLSSGFLSKVEKDKLEFVDKLGLSPVVSMSSSPDKTTSSSGETSETSSDESETEVSQNDSETNLQIRSVMSKAVSNEELLQENSKLKSLLAASQKTHDELKTNNDVISEDNATLTLELEEVKKKHAETLSALNDDLQRSQSYRNDLENKICKLRSGIKMLNSKLAEVISEITHHTNSIPEHTLSHEVSPSTSVSPASLPVVRIALEKLANIPKAIAPPPGKPIKPSPSGKSSTGSKRKTVTKKNHAVDETKKGFHCTCGVSVTSKSGLQYHIIYHTTASQFQCTVETCKRRFFTTTALRKHMLSRHNLVYTGREGCRKCGETFNSRIQLYQHCKVVHNCGPLMSQLKPSPPATKAPLSSKALPASIPLKEPVGKIPNQLESPARQPNRHTSVLNRDFPVHAPDPKIPSGVQCTCGTPFTSRAALLNHVKLRSTQNALFKCTFCPDTFPRGDLLRDHFLVSHHSMVGQLVTIGDSSVVIKSTSNATLASAQHGVATNADPAKKEFKCKCGQHFARKETLIEHLRVKLGLASHQCELCEMTFNRVDYLRTHLRRSHKVISQGFSCRICAKSGFKTGNDVKKHRKAHHGNEDPLWFCK